jgi:hypothetical protein
LKNLKEIVKNRIKLKEININSPDIPLWKCQKETGTEKILKPREFKN